MAIFISKLIGIKKRIEILFRGYELVNRSRIKFGKNTTIHRNCVFNADGELLEIGENCIFDVGVYVRLWGGKIKIGDNVFIGPYSVVYGHGGLTIGNNALIASHVTIIPANHNFSDKQIPINKQGETTKGVIIEDDVWVSTGVTILDGVNVGKGSVIAAGSVVTTSVPPYSVVGGVPGKIIKTR